KSNSSERSVKASQFFKGLFETDLKPGELITAVEFPALLKDERCAFLELTRRHGDYAIVGLAAKDERFVFFAVGSTPVLLVKRQSLEETRQALRAELNPSADLYNTAQTKLHLAGVLLERAWNTLSKPH